MLFAVDGQRAIAQHAFQNAVSISCISEARARRSFGRAHRSTRATQKERECNGQLASRPILAVAALSVATGITGAAYAADAYPSNPVRIVVAYPPGGAVDTIARRVAQKLSEQMGQQFMVENKPGASGTIGAREVARVGAGRPNASSDRQQLRDAALRIRKTALGSCHRSGADHRQRLLTDHGRGR